MNSPAFPNPRNRFVGRIGDLDRIGALRRAGAPIVTLWGPPGIGKTRLATEACRPHNLGTDRAWFCELRACNDLEEMCAAVVRGLGLPSGGGSKRAASLGAMFAQLPPGVVVLDNFEHLAAYAGETVAAWAERAPQVMFLATSRARLRLAAETTHEVLPLEEGAELFRERARAAAGAAGYLDEDTAERIARVLEGIPLAIELAAARLDVVGADGLASRLARPLEVLDHGARDADPAHATLRRAIETSSRLLDPGARFTLSACSVFRGAFPLEAAETVVGPERAARVVHDLQSLRDCSLLRSIASDGSIRFVFLDSIRSFAFEELAAREGVEETRARHASYFLSPARAGEPLDLPNLVDAVAHALETAEREPSTLERSIAALAKVEPSVASEAATELLSRALSIAEAHSVSRLVRAEGHRARGRALHLRGRAIDAMMELESALELGAEDPPLAAAIWADCGVIHHTARNLEQARGCYEKALELSQGVADEVARGRYLGNLGAVHHDLRREDAALEHYQRALCSFRAAGAVRLEGIFLANVATLYHEQGALKRARSTYASAIELLGRAGDARFDAITRSNLGILCHELGELDEARSCHEAALAKFRDLVDPRSECLCCGRLAMTLAALRFWEEALVRLRRAEKLARDIGDRVVSGVLQLHRAFVDLLCEADEGIARDRVAEARMPSLPEGTSLLEVSDDARFAARFIETMLAVGHKTDGELLVGADALWYQPPDGPRQDLGGRQTLRRLLVRLVEHHRRAPGQGVPLDAMREAGWPDRPAPSAAAMNRLHVALTELRRRGLRRWLLREGAGYLIDPALRVVLTSNRVGA